jgi:putative nucleotidyltransferase with HDIG domain
MDHPLLRKLAVDAPGTYHHSIVMGSLVEGAAEAIGANSLLARVSAYYHDIGKSKKPLYFIENMRGDNKHDKLNASMSALIILNHIKEGAELAKKHRLGSEITDIIKEHHGTTLMRFFYEKAKREAENVGAEPSEIEFRYAGPKPQTKESGLVMLADACEAASKTLPDPSPAVVQGMTQKIINGFFTDGQLDECELTLKDLHLIGKSFNRVFTGIFHHRIDYPEPAYIDGREDGVKGARRGPDKEGKEGEDKEGGREGLKRLGIK